MFNRTAVKVKLILENYVGDGASLSQKNNQYIIEILDVTDFVSRGFVMGGKVRFFLSIPGGIFFYKLLYLNGLLG